jgi:hypothetical protein
MPSVDLQSTAILGIGQYFLAGRATTFDVQVPKRTIFDLFHIPPISWLAKIFSESAIPEKIGAFRIAEHESNRLRCLTRLAGLRNSGLVFVKDEPSQPPKD